LLDTDVDKLEAERAKQLQLIEKQNRVCVRVCVCEARRLCDRNNAAVCAPVCVVAQLVRSTALALMLKEGSIITVEKSHTGTQTEDQVRRRSAVCVRCDCDGECAAGLRASVSECRRTMPAGPRRRLSWRRSPASTSRRSLRRTCQPSRARCVCVSESERERE
jgi:hypothetical protein